MPTRKGSLFLFRLLGVNVFIHYSWLAVIYFVYERFQNSAPGHVSGQHLPITFHVLSVLALFVIVLIHEFGHILATKSVGGKADTIVLWPLGGVAYVAPPQRPGPFLWSIVAGPLVNVILLPLTIIPAYLMRDTPTFTADFLFEIALTSAVLLIFNLLPIYPLDGGKILWSLLWFVAGRGLSLVIAASVGIAGSVGILILAIVVREPYTAVIAAFMGYNSFSSIKVGLIQRRIETAPRRPECRCPNCQEPPPIAPVWICSCKARFDTFATGAQCPNCGGRSTQTSCPFCYQPSPFALWYPQGAVTIPPMPRAMFPPPQPPARF